MVRKEETPGCFMAAGLLLYYSAAWRRVTRKSCYLFPFFRLYSLLVVPSGWNVNFPALFHFLFSISFDRIKAYRNTTDLSVLSELLYFNSKVKMCFSCHRPLCRSVLLAMKTSLVLGKGWSNCRGSQLLPILYRRYIVLLTSFSAKRPHVFYL